MEAALKHIEKNGRFGYNHIVLFGHSQGGYASSCALAGDFAQGEMSKQTGVEYIVKLDKSNWCLQCDELVGTLNLTKDEIKWREVAGPRPWLSGIVKGQMCALLHVPELIKMLSNGVDVATLLAESE